MNHKRWTYTDPTGRQHHVGLMHGAASGNLMLYYNGSVMLVDFRVHGSKDYSFFINEELCQVQVQHQGGQHYAYDMHVGLQPGQNPQQERRRRQRADLWKSLAFLAALALLVSSVFLLGPWLKETYENKLLRRHGVESEAVAIVAVYQGVSFVSFHFSYQGRAMQTKARPLADEKAALFPVKDGDEFNILFASTDPKVFRVRYDRPSAAQIERYIERTWQRHLGLHPELRPELARCTIMAAYALRGLEGLRLIHAQADSPAAGRACAAFLSAPELAAAVVSCDKADE